MQDSSIGMPSRTLRYSGSERPACRMNHTGVCGTGSRLQALRKAESLTVSDGAGGMDEAKDTEEGVEHTSTSAPPPFRAAVEALRAARLRPQIEVEPTP